MALFHLHSRRVASIVARSTLEEVSARASPGAAAARTWATRRVRRKTNFLCVLGDLGGEKQRRLKKSDCRS